MDRRQILISRSLNKVTRCVTMSKRNVNHLFSSLNKFISKLAILFLMLEAFKTNRYLDTNIVKTNFIIDQTVMRVMNTIIPFFAHSQKKIIVFIKQLSLMIQ